MRISDWSSDVCSSDLGDAWDAVRRDRHAGQERPVALLVAGLGGGERGRPHRAAVEAAPERHDARPPRGATGQLDGPVARLGPAVAEEHLRVVADRRDDGDRLGGPAIGNAPCWSRRCPYVYNSVVRDTLTQNTIHEPCVPHH